MEEKENDVLIRITNLSKIYQQGTIAVPALNQINLTIYRGEYVGIIGKSGAGKTTLLNMIAGLDDLSEGSITVENVHVDKLNEAQKAAWRGRDVGFIFQSFQLIPGLSLLDNVMLPMDFCGLYHPRLSEEKAASLLEKVGLAEHIHKKPSEISGGQQQRVAIARALANDPVLLLADEPTGRLDSATSETVFTIFKDLVAHGMTLVVVSHDRSLAERTERMIRLSDGQITEDSRQRIG